MYELAQRRLGFGRDCRRWAGDEEQGASLGRGQATEICARPAHQRPATAPPGLGVHRDPGDRQRLEVAPGGADRDLELLGHLGGRDPAAGLKEQQGGDQPIGAHAPMVPPKLASLRPVIARAAVVGARGCERLAPLIAQLGAVAGWRQAQPLIKIVTGLFDPPPASVAVPWGYLGLMGGSAVVAAAAAGELAIWASRRPVIETIHDL